MYKDNIIEYVIGTIIVLAYYGVFDKPVQKHSSSSINLDPATISYYEQHPKK